MQKVVSHSTDSKSINFQKGR